MISSPIGPTTTTASSKGTSHPSGRADVKVSVWNRHQVEPGETTRSSAAASAAIASTPVRKCREIASAREIRGVEPVVAHDPREQPDQHRIGDERHQRDQRAVVVQLGPTASCRNTRSDGRDEPARRRRRGPPSRSRDRSRASCTRAAGLALAAFASHGIRIDEPVVLRLSRSSCAFWASLSGYFWLTGILTVPLPTT